MGDHSHLKYLNIVDFANLRVGYSMFCVGYGIYTRERSNFLSSSYGNESQKTVGYAKYTTLNMVLLLHLIG